MSACVLLLGCSSTKTQSGAMDVESKLPSWILNPEKPGYQSVVGSAPKQDWGGREAQYRVALMKVRQELAQMVRVQVESTSKYRVEERAGKTSSEADTETRLRSSVDLYLDQAQVIDEWTDPQSGVLYIWLVTPK